MQLAIENELDGQCAFLQRPTIADLTNVPASPAVYVLIDSRGQVVLLASTQDLRRVLQSRFFDPADPEAGKRADLAEITRVVRWRTVSCAFEAKWRYWRLARVLHPKDYRERIGFGPAYFLHVDWSRPMPEFRVTERIWALQGEFLGPFQSAKATLLALEGLWDIFDLCRYPEQVRKAPLGIRCAYADMGRCDAPCDGSTPIPAYLERMHRAWRFASNIDRDEQLAPLNVAMRAAAASHQFEIAAQWKKRLDAAKSWSLSAAGLYREEELRFVIALPVTRRIAWKLLAFVRGCFVDGPVIPRRAIETEVPAWLKTLDGFEREEMPETHRMEQTWLFSQLIGIDARERKILLNLERTPHDRRVPEMIERIRAFTENSETPLDR